MLLRFVLIGLLALGFPFGAFAEDKMVRLHAPTTLVESGVLRYAMPRFSFKTQIAVELIGAADAADIVLGDAGRAVFEGAGRVWHMEVRTPDHPETQRLADWFLSDIGLRTVMAYAPDGEPLFAPPRTAPEAREAPLALTGDVALGQRVALRHCVRCHAIDAATRMAGIGSTPSFPVLRSLPDWQRRFTAFYTLNPHPAITVIPGLTPPFTKERPPPIAPLEMSQGEFEALLAFVAAMEAADLGAPLTHQ